MACPSMPASPDLDYAETAGGSTLDTEKGWLPTVGLGFVMLAFPEAPISNLYVRLDARASLGLDRL